MQKISYYFVGVITSFDHIIPILIFSSSIIHLQHTIFYETEIIINLNLINVIS
jgi:hypothetical protein